jgi:hypothetical protein
MQNPEENGLSNLVVETTEEPKLVITNTERVVTTKEKLEELNNLYERGAITRRQFLSIKSQLTGNIRRQSSYTKKRLSHEQRKARRKLQAAARRANRYKSRKGQKQSGRY